MEALMTNVNDLPILLLLRTTEDISKDSLQKDILKFQDKCMFDHDIKDVKPVIKQENMSPM